MEVKIVTCPKLVKRQKWTLLTYPKLVKVTNHFADFLLTDFMTDKAVITPLKTIQASTEMSLEIIKVQKHTYNAVLTYPHVKKTYCII